MTIGHDAGRTGFSKIAALPIVLFAACFACDLVFWKTGVETWITAALWLLGASLAIAALWAIVDLFDVLSTRRPKLLKTARWHAESNLVLVLIELCYLLARDAYGTDAIVPTGIVLSALIVGFFFSGWKRWGFERRGIDLTHGMGSSEPALKVRLLPHL